MATPGRNFEDYVHIPIYLVLLLCLWAMIFVRVRGVFQTIASFRTLRGLSAVFIITSGILCTIYLGLLCATYMLAHKVMALHGGPLLGINYPEPDPATFSDELVQQVIGLIKHAVHVCVASRFILTIGLWTVKFSFICIFLEVIDFLGQRTKVLVQATTLFILITLCLSIWSMGKDFAIAVPLVQPLPEEVRTGALRGGLSFMAGNGDVEFVLTVFNIGTDLLLLIISYNVYKALRFPLSAGLIVFVMVTITVVIATVRLIIVGLLFAKAENIDYSLNYNMNVAMAFLSECETVVGAIVSCLPGLRAYIRSNGTHDELEDGGNTKLKNLGMPATKQQQPGWNGSVSTLGPKKDVVHYT